MIRVATARDDAFRTLDQSQVELVRFLYIDNDGLVRGFVSHASNFADDLESGLTVAAAMPFFTAFDHMVPSSRFGCSGEWRLKPDPATLRALPYSPRQAAVICDFATTDMEPSPVCARTHLKRVLAGLEFEFKAAFENEFYLLAKDASGNLVPADQALCFSTSAMNAQQGFVLDVVDALKAQGIQVESYYPEYGPGQHEFAFRYDDALVTVDRQIMIRETIRAIAAKHGMVATFMPKPFAGAAGSGMHVHMSAWKDGRNLFYDASDRLGLSETAYHFIGGLLAHGRALCAFTAPSINSYKRLSAHAWAGAYTCYGVDNREAIVRVPSPLKGKAANSTRVEWKAIDASGNPYLALAAVIAAGQDGIRRKLHPGDALQIDPTELSAAERSARRIEPLPSTMAEALDAAAADPLFRETFGELFLEEYLALKRHDWAEYNSQVTEWEFKKYVDIF